MAEAETNEAPATALMPDTAPAAEAAEAAPAETSAAPSSEGKAASDWRDGIPAKLVKGTERETLQAVSKAYGEAEKKISAGIAKAPKEYESPMVDDKPMFAKDDPIFTAVGAEAKKLNLTQEQYAGVAQAFGRVQQDLNLQQVKEAMHALGPRADERVKSVAAWIGTFGDPTYDGLKGVLTSAAAIEAMEQIMEKQGAAEPLRGHAPAPKEKMPSTPGECGDYARAKFPDNPEKAVAYERELLENLQKVSPEKFSMGNESHIIRM